jgi:hypothetical protein
MKLSNQKPLTLFMILWGLVTLFTIGEIIFFWILLILSVGIEFYFYGQPTSKQTVLLIFFLLNLLVSGIIAMFTYRIVKNEI